MEKGLTLQTNKFLCATQKYLKNLEISGASPKTVRNYSDFLKEFYDFLCKNNLEENDPTYTTIFSWRDYLFKKNTMSTVCQKLKVLKMFFAWATDEGLQEEKYYNYNPVASSLFPKMRKTNLRPYDMLLTDEQVIQLFANNPPPNYKITFWPRNYAIIVLLLTTEIRNSELRDIKLYDVDFENSQLYVEHGKGDKFRIVEIPLLAQTAIKIYLESGFRPKNLKDTDYLFGKIRRPIDKNNPQWEKGRDNWLSQIVENHVYSITGVSNITSHDLRHVGARIDLNSGMRIEELQAKLGHSNPVTTQIYSGKIMPRGSRESAKKVIEEQQIQAQRNNEILTHMKLI